jgi:hypothetical protein
MSRAAMVDRAYKGSIPDFRRTLEKLRKEFSKLPTATDWNRLRIEPLLKHVESLDRVLRSPRHAGEVSRLKRGVSMFHSDLVYLRLNVKALEEILHREKRAVGRHR